MGIFKDLFKSDREKADALQDEIVAKMQGLDKPDYAKRSRDLDSPTPEEQKSAQIKRDKEQTKRKKEIRKSSFKVYRAGS